MAHRVAPQAEADLEDIWLYVAKESGSTEVASRLIDSITSHFFTLATFPFAGRLPRGRFCFGMRSFAVSEYIVVYCVEGADVFILRVVHGRRDLEGPVWTVAHTMKNPPPSGDFIRTEIIAPAGLSVTAAAVALQVSRPALSSLLNGKADPLGRNGVCAWRRPSA